MNWFRTVSFWILLTFADICMVYCDICLKVFRRFNEVNDFQSTWSLKPLKTQTSKANVFFEKECFADCQTAEYVTSKMSLTFKTQNMGFPIKYLLRKYRSLVLWSFSAWTSQITKNKKKASLIFVDLFTESFTLSQDLVTGPGTEDECVLPSVIPEDPQPCFFSTSNCICMHNDR